MNLLKIFFIIVFMLGTAFGGLYAQDNTVKADEKKEVKKDDGKKKNLAKEIFSFDPLRRKGKDEKKLFFTLGGFYLLKFGNTETFNTNGSVNFVFDDGIANFELGYRTFYGENKGMMNEHNGFCIVKFDYFVVQRLEVFIFSSGEYNEVSKLLFRSNTGAGLKFVAFRNKYWKTDISFAPVFQYEKFDGEDDDFEARASFRYRIRITPIKIIELSLAYFYVPKFENWLQYRMVVDTYMVIGLSTLACLDKGVHFKVGYLREHNENALPGTEKIDQKIYGELQLKV